MSMKHIVPPRKARFFQFVDEVCVKNPEADVLATDMLQAYSEWLRINNLRDNYSPTATMSLIKETFPCQQAMVGRQKRWLVPGISVNLSALAKAKKEKDLPSVPEPMPTPPVSSAPVTQTQQAPPPDLNLDALIDRILRRQEARTLRSLTMSRAMQALIVRLDAALDADEPTLRATVREVLDDLGHAVTWGDERGAA